MAADQRPLVWIGPAKKELLAFPDEVQHEMGFGLWRAQEGKKHPRAKPLKGFGGAGVLEIVADDEGKTYRTVYAVRLRHAVYVLHAFQKKAKHGIKTPDSVMNLVRQRLREAEELDERVATITVKGA